jgi:hypothetical protein
MSLMKNFAAAAVLAFVAAGRPVTAQGPDALRSIKKLRCTFSTYATGTWVDGAARAEVKAGKLSVGFDAVDMNDGTADTIGAFGPVHITVRLTGTTAHFMQMDTSGALYLTTVFAPGGRDQLPAGKLRAVHTRHEYTEVSLPGFTSRPEQYYGECDVN